MLLKIEKVVTEWQYDAPLGEKVTIASTQDYWINPERVYAIEPLDGHYEAFSVVCLGRDRYTVTRAEAQRIIDHINGTEESPDQFALQVAKILNNAVGLELQQRQKPVESAVPGVVDAHRLVHIDTMTLDSFYSKTAGSARRMWRCTSEEGISFNIFDHVDHRNTYKLFQDAGLDLWMDDMDDGDKLDWSASPIGVYLQQNGDFFNPVKIDEFDTTTLDPVKHRDEDYPEDPEGE